VTRPKNASAFQGQRKYGWKDEHLWSVTTILQSYPKPWLGAWAAKMVAEHAVLQPADAEWRDLPPEDQLRYLKGVPWRKRDDAADFGTALHETLAALVAGRKIGPYPGAEGHVKALVEWWDTYRPLVYDSEVQVFNLTEGYAGSLDLIADVYGRRLLIDLKSGSAIGHDVRLQLAAYRYAEFIGEDDHRIADVPDVEGCAVLWIPRDNPAFWQFIEVNAGAAEFAEFLGVRRLHLFTKHNEKSAIGELILPQARVEVA
jgi:hypothetical protein